jgi:mannose-1-phosphate guanylyltransferase / mannose-6-phosphate isomerase
VAALNFGAPMNKIVDRSRLAELGSAQIHPVILSGGAGTRLWPLSRALHPKQLLPLLSSRTLLQETAARSIDDAGFAAPIIICNEEHRFMITEQLREIGLAPQRILLEPAGRNTAPALAVVASWLVARDPEAVMLVQPSDHLIGSPAAFYAAVVRGLAATTLGRLVTFGVTPNRPEPGYGYIQAGIELDGVAGANQVSRFVEKPDRETAQRFIDSGKFYWNSGIFLMSARQYLDELQRLHPVIHDSCADAVARGSDDGEFFRLDAASFAEAPSLSIDHAVMEHTDRAAVVPVDMAWSDVGSWQALRDAGQRDADGNIVQGDVLLEDVRDCYVRSDGRLVAAIGLDDVVVVSTDDAVLVAKTDRAAEVGRIVERLRQRNRPEPIQHTTVYRPWGYYRTVDGGERYQVKRIMVKPGAKLSLQKHFHRAEHWVVVQGTAMVTKGEENLLVRENESIYIPLGTNHRLENPGKLPLHLIEVQSGAYLGEDDIVRISDTYGRA